MTFIKDTDQALERAIGWLYLTGAGTPLKFLAGAGTVIIPFVIVFDEDPSGGWIAPYLICLAATWLLEHYHLGAIAGRLAERFGVISASFAGGVEELTDIACRIKGKRMPDADVNRLCVGFLHRIRDFAQATMVAGESPRLRATLAVPVVDEAGNVEALRVWCYDSTYELRNYSTISLRDSRGNIRPGAPSAYDAGITGISIIYDTHGIPGIDRADRRPYRSIASFSVPRIGRNGKPLAVVNIDASRPSAFSQAVVLRRIRPHIGPVLATIGLVLALRRNEVDYEFPG